jgi:hypothetical protein
MILRKVGSSQLLSMLGVQMMELLGIEATGICDMQGTARGRQQGTVFKAVHSNRMLLGREFKKRGE